MFGGEEVQDRCKCLWEESFWQQQEITSGIWFIVFYKKKKKTVNNLTPKLNLFPVVLKL